jgi:ubiquinone/menaquinone biosynthesis C-methylase UbiE
MLKLRNPLRMLRVRTSRNARGQGDAKDLAKFSAEDVVTALYNGVLGREPDPEGLKAWSRALAANALSVRDVAAQMRSSPERTNGDDSTDLYAIGRRDAHLSGWYPEGGDELYSGFRISEDDVVVDVGCGAGSNSEFCGARGAHVIFADVDPAKVEATLEKVNQTPARKITPLLSDASPLPIADGVASRIICTEVLEHVDDPGQILRELARVGQPGALYLLAVPDPIAEHLQKQVAHPAYFQKPNHIRIIERDQFALMVEDAGLTIERRACYGFYHAIRYLIFWPTKIASFSDHHPILDNWARTWTALIDTEGGLEIKRALDDFLPKSQIIVARKPGTRPTPAAADRA